MEKPNCYECKHRGTIPGDCHSTCGHPALAVASNDPLAKIMGILAGVGRVPPIQAESSGIMVKGNPIGIKNGWFNHPWNFDPIWLEECDGFQAKK